MTEPNKIMSNPRAPGSDLSLRKLLYIAIVVFGILPLLVLLVVKSRSTADTDLPEGEASSTAVPLTPLSPRSKRSQTLPPPREVSIWDASQSPTKARTFATVKRGDSEGESRSGSAAKTDPKELLSRLLGIDSGALTAAEAKEVNEMLEQIASLGAASIPAIQEYLEQGQNVNFDTLEGGEFVNYPSLRIALLDALAEIGGPIATGLIAQSLQNVVDPLEIALVANELEHLAPGKYRELAVAAARSNLAAGMASRDASPLFEVLQSYGDSTVAKDLEQSALRYNYYSTLALAALPDGAGIPALIRLAQDPAISAMGNGDYALRILAQSSLQYPEAWTALSQQALANQIPDTAWPTVASSLAGNYLQFGNPVYANTTPPTSWTPAQISQRITMIDKLLAAATNPVAIQSLQQARATLVAKQKN